MRQLTELARRLLWLGRRSRFERELEEEIEFHIETRADELEQEGLPRGEALDRARREFGPRLRSREQTRSAWQIRWAEDLAADLRYAARAFRRDPAFALTAVFCLALGVGANATMFSVAMEVLFSEPSCRDAATLVQLQVGGNMHCPAREYRFLREARLFDGLAGMNIGEVVNWRDGEGSYRLAGTRVTPNFFEVTGMPVALGRPFESTECDAAVATHGFWTRRLNADPNVVGRKLVLDGRPFTLVGVLPRDHRNLAGFGFTPDLYLTLDSSEYLLYARLPRAMDHTAAHARLLAACRDLDHVYPDANRKWSRDVSVYALGGTDRLRVYDAQVPGGSLAFFAVLLAATALVLLVACANVAGLLVARALSRQREIAIRVSLGASRGRILRQLLAESLLLTLCGAGAGLLIDLGLTHLLSGVRLSFWIPIEFQIRPDWRLLTYSIAVAAIATMLTGLLPAVKASSARFNPRSRLRSALVMAQLAVSVVLLCGGWLFVRGLLRAASTSPGFDTERAVWATFRPVPGAYTPERFQALIAEATERLRLLPGVEAASPARAMPISMPISLGGEFRPDTTDRSIRVRYNFNAVGPGYFGVLRIPILRGRAFLDSDREGGPAAVILNENLARRLFGKADPVGHTLRLPDKQEARVVGVARNSRYSILAEPNPMALYRPYAQSRFGLGFAHLVVRARSAPETPVREVERTLSRLDPAAAVETRTLRSASQILLLPSRVGAAVFGAMALLGLALAAIGLYGVLLVIVNRRFREIGIRIALGATPTGVLRTIARESFRLAATGAAIGLAISVIAVRPLAIFLVAGVSPADPMNSLAVAGILLLVAALATITPALRALRIDPATSLRHE